LTPEIVHSILKEYKVISADVFCRCDATIDQLIDVIEGNRKYIPCIYVLNKIDQLTIEELDIIDQMPFHVPISAAHGWNFDELLESIWEQAKMIRIYTKPKGQIPDYGAPVVLHDSNPSIEYFCNKLHKGILNQFKYAWVWGSSVRHQPQKVYQFLISLFILTSTLDFLLNCTYSL
jgi:ribosome-interacting GTPase 1